MEKTGKINLSFREISQKDRMKLIHFFERNNKKEITRYFDPFPLNSESVDKILQDKKNKYYICILDGKFVAFFMFRWWRGCEGVTPGAFVDYKNHGRGIGAKVYRQFVKEAKKLNIKKLVAHVYPDNVASLKILKTLDFKKIGTKIEEKNGEQKEKIILELKLR